MMALPPIVYVLLAFASVLAALILFLCLRSRAKAEPPARPQRIKLPVLADSNETRTLPSWVWRVPFMVSGSAVTACAIIPILYPVNFFTYANATLQVFLSYALIYACIVAYGASRVFRSENEPLEPSNAQSSFFYAFIVPNYKEDEEVLDATLSHLAAHPYSRRQFIVVLAMEEREEGVNAKAERLRKKFRPKFLEMSYSLHELIKGSECPGKASNATAAGIVLSSLCRKNRINAALVNVTVMDADTLISPRYHLRLDTQLTQWQAAGETGKVTRTIFTPYMSFVNVDSAEISMAVATTDLVWGMTQMFHITRATPIRFAVSTYSLSLDLLESTGYWEVGDAGIGEDTHEALKVFFATAGEARTMPIYETFRCQCLHSEGDGVSGFIESVRQRYKQAARHALGHIDIGYTLYKCWTCTSIPMRLRLVCILQSVEIVYWMMGVMLGWGAFLSTVIWWVAANYVNPKVCYRGGTIERVACYHDVDNAPPVDPVQHAVSVTFACVWGAVTIMQMSSAEYLSAHHLRRTPREWVRALLKWLTSPLVFIMLFMLPAVESHWTLFKREKLTYNTAPKSAGSTPASSCLDLESLDAARSKGGGAAPPSPFGGQKGGGAALSLI